MLVEVAVVDTWVVVSVAAGSMEVAAPAEVLAAIAVDTAAELMEAVITAVRILAVMQAEAGTAGHTQAEAALLPGPGRGKAKARHEAILPAGTDPREITVR